MDGPALAGDIDRIDKFSVKMVGLGGYTDVMDSGHNWELTVPVVIDSRWCQGTSRYLLGSWGRFLVRKVVSIRCLSLLTALLDGGHGRCLLDADDATGLSERCFSSR